MVDKYAHLRPPRPRECYTSDRRPKIRYSETFAKEMAAKYEGYHAYECSHCGWWHTGRNSKGPA